jgi:hypothetical protein
LIFFGFGFELSSFEFHELAISVSALFFKFKNLSSLTASLTASLQAQYKNGGSDSMYTYMITHLFQVVVEIIKILNFITNLKLVGFVKVPSLTAN